MRFMPFLPWLLLTGPAWSASFAVTQAINPPIPVAGDTVTYQIVVEVKTGTGITALTVTDTISPVLIGATAYGPSGMPPPLLIQVPGSGTLMSWSMGGLSVSTGDTFTFSITGSVGLVCPPLTITSTAYAWADDVSGTEFSDTRTFSLTFVPALLQYQVPVSPAPGVDLAYVIVVANQGQVTIENLLVVDTIGSELLNPAPNAPAGFTVTLTPAGPNTIVAWSGGGVRPGDPGIAFSVTGTANVGCTAISVTNTGWVQAWSACGTTELTQYTNWAFDPGVITAPTGLTTRAGDG